MSGRVRSVETACGTWAAFELRHCDPAVTSGAGGECHPRSPGGVPAGPQTPADGRGTRGGSHEPTA
eukprot:2385802-Alexandrium_andersonii.AAC.1